MIQDVLLDWHCYLIRLASLSLWGTRLFNPETKQACNQYFVQMASMHSMFCIRLVK